MTTVEMIQLDSVLDVVLTWPRERQLSLARRVLDHLDQPPMADPPKKSATRAAVSREDVLQMLAAPDDLSDDDALSLEELEGSLATDVPPPTDEEVERWLEERRMRKYG